MYLGLDIGTGSVKAALLHSGKSSFYSAAYPANTAPPGRQNGPLLSETVQQLFLKIAAALGRDLSALHGIALSGHGPSALLAGRDGEALTDLITWQDHTRIEEERQIQEQFPDLDWGGSSFEASGHSFFTRRPELFSKGVSILYPKDYINLLLTGVAGTDRATASSLVFWDDARMLWDCKGTGEMESFLPDVIEPWEELGQTGTSWSRECGLPDGVPVYAGGIDAFCELLGSGAVYPGALVDGSGTSTCLSIILPETPDAPDTSMRKPGPRHVIPGLRFRIEMMSFTGGSFQWMLGLLEEDLEEDLERAKEAAALAPVPLLFLPWLQGERSPIWDKRASGAFIGLGQDTRRQDLFAALFQGIAFGIRQNLELLEKDLPGFHLPPGRQVIAAGGGSLNEEWMQIKADITGKEYHKLECSEAAPLGDALLAIFAREKGAISDYTDHYVTIEKVFTPDPRKEKSAAYNHLYKLYCNMYDTLKTTFHGLAEVAGSEVETGAKA